MHSDQKRLVPVSAAVLPEIRETLREIAKRENRSVSQILRFVIERYARRQKKAA